jgi:ketosteroid isomerase-like protein
VRARRALSFLDPHVVLDVSRTGGIDSVFYGHEAVAGFFRRYAGTFEDYRWEVERLSDVGSGTVLAVLREAGRGKGGGVPVDRSLGALYTVIDGRIARITTFHAEREALKAAGLLELAMSQENVEVVRRVYERFSEGDFPASVDLFDPHVLLVLGPGFFEAGTYLGPEAIAAYTRVLLEPWTQLTLDAEEIVAAGDSVLVGVRQHGVGRASGVPTDAHYFTLWTSGAAR